MCVCVCVDDIGLEPCLKDVWLRRAVDEKISVFDSARSALEGSDGLMFS